MTDDDLPATLTIEEAFRSAYFMIQTYGDVENWRSEDLVLLAQYMRSDPARSSDWKRAVRMALELPDAVSTDED
jgi:hypothetical protein